MKKFPYMDRKEFGLFKKLDTPIKIQNFLNSLPYNFEQRGDTNMSPLTTLEKNTAHCMEGALLAGAILWYHGIRPLIVDLKTTPDDIDHVITVFKQDGYWGALSKTNHGVLRYRDPVYKNIRELVMSYFNEYFLNSTGEKTLRSFSEPFDLSTLAPEWIISSKNLWNLVTILDKSPHTKIIPNSLIKNLRKAEKIEIEMGTITEWKPEKPQKKKDVTLPVPK